MIRGTEGGVQWNVLGPGAAEVNNLTEEEEKELGSADVASRPPATRKFLETSRYHGTTHQSSTRVTGPRGSIRPTLGRMCEFWLVSWP